MNRTEQTERKMAWIWLLLVFLCTADITRVAGIYITMEPSITPMFTKLGSNFTIKCIVKDAPAKATVRVVNIDYDDVENRNFKISKNVEMENGQPVTVVIVNKDAIESTDAGGYICIADKKEKHFNLVVTQVLVQSSNVTVGEDVTIKCDPNTNFNQISVDWTKNGQQVDAIPGVKDRVKFGDNKFALTLQKTVEDDAGEYVCKFTFFKDTPMEHSFTDMAKMYGKPFFRNEKADSTLSLSGNDSIDISCEAYGYPKPDVTWLKDNEVIQPEGRVSIKDTDNGSRLKIKGIFQKDAGEYICNVENSLGRKQRSFVVTIEGVINSATFIRYGLAQLVLLASVLFLTL